MKEDFFRYGENNRGFGMLSLPETMADAPIVILFNAGLLHREEPYRLNVLLGRQLAELGYIVLRVDLSGKGDTPARLGLNNRESVALDWGFIKEALYKRFGVQDFILGGLCSGADNAIKLTALEPCVKGLILMDPISSRDNRFYMRNWFRKISNPYKWLTMHSIFARFVYRHIASTTAASEEMESLRDKPTREDEEQCFSYIMEKRGRVLAIFTSHALSRYNEVGQYARASGIENLADCCDEVFFPHAMHLYPVQAHRDQLISTIANWASTHLKLFQGVNR
ncbi:MAG: hypothetical protein KUG82_11160 [Pseudomonadales bacterium]|nr:hypothetical protein [Pseudomonadales bacterium]